MNNSTDWYSRGLRFSCVRCGRCCHVNGDYAYVYISPQEASNIMEALDIPRKEFMKSFCSKLDGNLILRFRDDVCPFYENGACSIYSVRPVQCNAWPFWEENLDEWTWHEEVAPICPGVDRGRLYSAAEIEKICLSVNHQLDYESEVP